jgi:uncharacterized repeat protein (TIGR01451 family)
MVAGLPAKKYQLCQRLAAKPLRCPDEPAQLAQRLRGSWHLGLLCCTAALAVPAQPASHAPQELVVSSTLERIVAASSESSPAEVRITADTVASHADQLIISVRFTNTSESVVDTVRITSPIPADVKYVPGSASGPGSDVLFSVDNGRTFGKPEELTLRAADGGRRTADAADYTHVRWVLNGPLDVGATGIARFRAVPR